MMKYYALMEWYGHGVGMPVMITQDKSVAYKAEQLMQRDDHIGPKYEIKEFFDVDKEINELWNGKKLYYIRKNYHCRKTTVQRERRPNPLFISQPAITFVTCEDCCYVIAEDEEDAVRTASKVLQKHPVNAESVKAAFEKAVKRLDEEGKHGRNE